MRLIFGVAGLGIAAAAIWFFATGGAGHPAPASKGEVNVYSARHYEGDRELFRGFEKATGIRVNVFEASAEQLVERLKAEGDDSPADVIITVDAGNIWRAQAAGLLQPVHSSALEQALTPALRHPDGLWFALTRRVRVFAVDKTLVPEGALSHYADLADPAWRGRVCVRSSSNVYNLSLMSALIARWGSAEAEAWAKGVVANFARAPQGEDTDQVRAIAAGLCRVAIVNHYYVLRMLNSANAGDHAAAEKVRLIFPDQDGLGVHTNISAAGIARHAHNVANGTKFIEYLLQPAQQQALARANQEFPAATGVLPDSPLLKALPPFRTDALPLAALGPHQAEAQAIYDRAGWK